MEEFSLYVNESNYNDCKPVVRRSIAYTCAEEQNFGDIYHESWLVLLKYIIKHKKFTFADCSFLVKVARRICFKWLRKQSLYEEIEQQLESDLSENITENFRGIALNTLDKIFIIQRNKIFGDETRDDIGIILIPPLTTWEQELMDRVGERCWKILLLRFYYNYPAEKIAEIMGWENAAVVYNEVYRCVRRAIEIIRELKNQGAWN